MSAIKTWPFPAVDEQSEHCWVESTEKAFYDLLGAVPPLLYVLGGFVVGEEYDSSPHGPIHTVCIHRFGRYFFRNLPVVDAEKFARELLDVLGTPFEDQLVA